MYADVQAMDEKLKPGMEVDEDEVVEASKGKDWKKLKELINEYEMFKITLLTKKNNAIYASLSNWAIAIKWNYASILSVKTVLRTYCQLFWR